MTTQRETPPIVVPESDGTQNSVLQGSGISTEDLLNGSVRVEEQFLPSDDIDDDNDDGPGPSENFNLGITINEPKKDSPLSGSLSQGVKITAKGSVVAQNYTDVSVDVQFGEGAPFSKASLFGNKWTINKTITKPGSLTITARVKGTRDGETTSETKPPITRTVTINLSDDIPPTAKFLQPSTDGAQILPDGKGKYFTMLQVTAEDNASGIKRVEYISGDLSDWAVIPPVTPPTSPPTWQKKIKLNYKLDQQTIGVLVTDGADRQSLVTRTVKTVDNTKPTLEITVPENGVDLPAENEAAGVVLPRLEGRASDGHSGVQKVEWALNPLPNTTYKPATPESPNNWSSWSVKDIAIPGPAGPNRIKVRSFDVVGNVTEQEINVAVSLLYPPKDPTVQEYFSSLIDFVVRRAVKDINVNPKPPVRVEDLEARFFQPFQRLLGAAPSNQQVHQIRICIEVLRRYFAKPLFGWPDDSRAQGIMAKLQLAEADYRQRAYETLLNRIGTSFDELRAARLADPPARRALAQRLGFDLPGQRVIGLTPAPDRLDQLLLQPGQFTEADLETLFGLVDTTRDPLEQRNSNPKLLNWQLQSLEAEWVKQDKSAPAPIIDPDLIGEEDLRPSSNLAYEFWQNRQNWVTSQLASFKEQLKTLTKAGPLPSFDQVVGNILGPIRDLQAFDAERLAGADIEPRLAGKQLTLPAFVRLMQLRTLISTGASLTVSEADDVASILVQVQKLRSFADWRDEEQAAGLVLGPAFFRVPAAGTAVVLPGVSPEWRVDVEARQNWQDTLRARSDQRESLKQALLSAVDTTEEETLPVLHDGLVQALAELEWWSGADEMTKWLLIDIGTSGYGKITRVEQAIQTLQALLVALRVGPLFVPPLFNPWKWDLSKESQQQLDEELRWMGSYATWYSAMQVFLYPENLLLPTLRPVPDQLPSVPEKEEQTPAFKQLLKDLRKSPQLTPEKAQDLADDYLYRLKSDYESRKFSLTLPPPIVPGKPFQITEQYTKNELLTLSNWATFIIGVNAGSGNPPAKQLQNIHAYLREVFYFVPIALALQLQKSGQYLSALDWFRVVYAYDLPVNQRKIYHGLKLERDLHPDPKLLYRREVYWLKDALNPHNIVNDSYNDPGGKPDDPRGARHDAYTRFVVMSLARCFLDFADAEFTHDTNESLPRARSLYTKALELLDLPEMRPPAGVVGLSPNPVVAGLKLRAQTNLAKLHSGRNITGLRRQLEPPPITSQAGSLPLAGSGPFGATSSRALQPTPYRYSVLIDRAKQLVGIAQQAEAAFLAALEKRDGEAYNLLKANQDLGMAQANVQLQDLRVIEAADSLILADKQQERAEFQVQAYQGFLDAGMNVWERKLLEDYHDAFEARTWVTSLDAAITMAQALTESSSGGILGTGVSFGHAGAAAVGALSVMKGAASAVVNAIEANIQTHSLRASYEQRAQEWTLQKGLAEKDVAISAQQVQLAIDHQNIVDQELLIAELQTANAQATVEFLAGKFTNVELYEWMSGILQEVYSYFLQQATAIARLAQNQLAFERQEGTPLFIQDDYWEPPAGDSAFGNSSDPDRRGLTGSARLLQDVYQLDQFAFETDKRKLQLSKTFSLARLAPLEFQRFRETGMLSFATPMALFDSEFPGHYLRMIKRVRTSVVALIPPNQGIRATLTTPGVSRVVIGGDVFQPISVRRDPESVALTSPSNATGVFELEAQSEMLLPFEFMGVDTFWNLEMPKAANLFDYRTIADVLFTIEYTALSSSDYRRQVIQRLDRTVSADRPYSFRDQFADQWYDLHNPDQTARPMRVSFSTTREDFPPNVEHLSMGQVALYFVLADGKTVKDFRPQLRFTEQGSETPVGGEATATPEGITSTRLGNAPSWTPMLNRSPFGEWELALPNTAEVRNLFTSETISDIVFVITCSGRSPDWPA